MTDSFTLSFSFRDHKSLWLAAQSVNGVDAEMASVFAAADFDLSETYGLPELLFASEEFQNGSILRCVTLADALLTKKIHRAAGYNAFILHDTSVGGQPVVVTTWSHLELDETTKEVLLELSFMRPLELYTQGTLKEDVRGALGVSYGDADLHHETLNHEDHSHETVTTSIMVARGDFESLVERLTDWCRGNARLDWRIAQEV